MIERILLALLILLVVLGIGLAVRAWDRRRCVMIASRKSFALSDTGELPQIITFYGQNCGACEKQKNINDDLDIRLPGVASFRYVDAAAESSLALDYGVIVVPTTFVVSKAGRIVAVTSGVMSGDCLTAFLAESA